MAAAIPEVITAKVGDAVGEMCGFQKDTLELYLDAPFAPGTPVSVEIGQMRIDAKSLGSKKMGERFLLRVQLRTVTRVNRRRLVELAKRIER